MYSSLISVAALLSLVPSLVSAHGLILAANGANGIDTAGFAVVDGTPRDTGAGIKKVEGDTSIIRDNEIASGKAGACGRTEFGGSTDVTAAMQAAVANGLATASPGGTVTMAFHQVNGDGAGPYTCECDPTGTGQNFAAMTVTQNIPGKNSLSNARATNFTLIAQMAAGTTCSGTGGACLIRCRNNAAAGPFGGCTAVTNSASNSTDIASSPSSAVAPSASSAVVSSGAAAAAPVVSSGAAAASPVSAASSSPASSSAGDASTADASTGAQSDKAVAKANKKADKEAAKAEKKGAAAGADAAREKRVRMSRIARVMVKRDARRA